MVRILLIFLLILSFFFNFEVICFAQSNLDEPPTAETLNQYSEEEFQWALRSYVQKLLINFNIEAINKERFLVSVMRLVNNEMNNRITNKRAAVERYFNDIKNQLNELQMLKSRLRSGNISELDAFVVELEKRMKTALDSDELDYKKKKVFDDALQLLYVAEEMIKLDQLSDTSNLNRKISSSKQMLLSAFGEVGEYYDEPLDIEPTIFNLFDEWQKTESYKYSARLMDVKVARSNLLKAGSIQEVNRMFNDQLRFAYLSFNDFEYDLADRHFEDLINTYEKAGVKDFEDVYFYWGESNFALGRLFQASNIFTELINQYPNSIYLSRTYSRLIQIFYKMERFDDVLKYFSQYQTVASSQEPDFYDINFIAALSLYNRADFNRSIEILSSLPSSSEFYNFAQYLIGKVYAAGQNYDLAIDVFDGLVNSNKTPEDIRSRALLKLAQIAFERSAYTIAISYANTIPKRFPRYDRVLNILMWSHFMIEKTTQVDPDLVEFPQTKYYANRLIDEFYGSEYRMEAKSLLGYIYQLENKLSLARNYYKNVYDSKINRRGINQHLLDKDSLYTLYNQSIERVEEALRKENRMAYQQAASLSEGIEDKILEMDFAEMSTIGAEMSEEINELLLQIDELNILREKARASGNAQAMAKIDSIVSRLKSSVEIIPGEYSKKAVMFSAYPVARKVANYEYISQRNEDLRAEILNEVKLIDENLKLINNQIERSKFENDFKKIVSLELKEQELLKIRKKYDNLYLQTFDSYAGEPYVDFDRWGDFGAVGIIDVDFGQRDKIRNRMIGLSGLYNSIIERVTSRREIVEDHLKKIEAEIRFMTMKARLEERQRLRAEREQSFRETFFDTRTSEFEEK